jgi:hypothetical protein
VNYERDFVNDFDIAQTRLDSHRFARFGKIESGKSKIEKRRIKKKKKKKMGCCFSAPVPVPNSHDWMVGSWTAPPVEGGSEVGENRFRLTADGDCNLNLVKMNENNMRTATQFSGPVVAYEDGMIRCKAIITLNFRFEKHSDTEFSLDGVRFTKA